jgi:2',3'-cyclic-nucleotide 2'-phosphodiesterase (5'-nucleotidase family)
MKKQFLVFVLSLSLISCAPNNKSLALNQNNPVSFADGSGHFSDGDGRTYTVSKGSDDGDWFTLSQGGYLTNDAADDHINYTSITVDYILSSSYGCLSAKASQYAITSPENGASELQSSTTFTFSGNANQYFSLYAVVGSFEIKSVVLTYNDKVEKAADPTTLDFYSINDTHGAVDLDLTSNPKRAGIEKLSAYLSSVTKQAPDSSIILSSGDMWQGSATSNMTRGAVMVDWMNVAGFESMAIGNHEFDWTASKIAENAAQANFPFLGINILDPSGKRPSWAGVSKIVNRGKWKIGVIGAIGQLKDSIAVSSLAGYSFRDDYAELVHDEADRLRNNEGCDLVVLSIHNGEFQTANCHNIDAVFEGHSHSNYDRVDSYGIPHVQCSAYGTMFQKVSFEEKDGKLVYTTSSPIPYETISTASEEPMSLSVYGYYDGLVAEKKQEVLGQTKSYLSTTTLVNLAAQTSYEYYQSKWDSEIIGAILNNGSARKAIAAGTITFGDVYNSFPFDNDNVIYKVKGSDLLQAFMSSTSLTTYTPLARSAIQSETIYKVMCINYVAEKAEYAPYLTEISRDSVVRTRDIVADYFRSLNA